MGKRWILGFTAACLLLGLVSPEPFPAMAAEKASLRLNWIIIGQHPPYYLGLKRGYYKEQGIDLTVNEGRGSGVAAQLVANGDDDFGLADAGTVISTRAKGAPLAVIMSIYGISNLGVIARADSGIKTIKDVIGKNIAVTPGDALTQVFPALLAANGIAREQVNLQFMDPAAKVVSVLAGKSHALLGGIDDQTITIESKGVKTSVVRFADYGVNTLSVSAFTSLDKIKKNPELVRRFVHATQRSWEEARKDPVAAVEAAMSAKPGIDRENLLAQLKSSLTFLGQSDRGIGWADKKLWEDTIDIMKKYRDLKTDVPVADHYDYSFLK